MTEIDYSTLKAQTIGIATQNSVVPHEKLVFLWDCVSNAPSGDLVEVGCWRGGSSLTIATAAQSFKPGSVFFICDTFKGVALTGEKDNVAKDGDFGDTSREHVTQLLESRDLSNFRIVEGIFPHTSEQVTSKTISFLHIDVDTYEGYKAILHWAQDKLVPGAIIVFDDYAYWGCKGVDLAVNEYFEGRNDFELHLQNVNDISSWAKYTP